jgi:hypothetical protein
MPRDGKNAALSKKSGTIIAIAPAHGLSGGTNSTFHSTLHLLIF